MRLSLSVRHRMLGANLVLWLVFALSWIGWLYALMAPADAFRDLMKYGRQHDSLVTANLNVQRMIGLLPEVHEGRTVARAELRTLGAETEQTLQSLRKLPWPADDAAALLQAHREFHALQRQADGTSSSRHRAEATATRSTLVKTLDRLLSADTIVQRSRWNAHENAHERLALLFAACIPLALAVCIGLWHVLARSVTVPIERIAKATQPISDGYLSTRIPVVSNDEIGQLTEAFNFMMNHMEGNFLGVAEAWSQAVDEKSPWTRGHSHRVTKYALDIAQQLNLDERTMSIAQFSGLLHDIGKLITPLEILDKQGRLTDEEFEIMKQHTVIGHRILSPIPFFKRMLDGVRHHHERYDGRGYPDGLAGENIPYLARLLAVADAYDAMTSDRPYRRGMPPEQALRILAEDDGQQWDIEVVEAFMRTCDPRLSRVKQPSETLALPVPVDTAPVPMDALVTGRAG